MVISQKTIAKSILELRQSTRLTQEQFANEIGVSLRQYRRYETAGTSSIDVVNLFARACGVDALDIIQGTVFDSVSESL